MKISLNWLKDYVACGVSPEKLAERLTMAGLEVEKISWGGNDTIFELEITPNRPDCLNMLGIARETAAILKKPRKFPKIKKHVWPKKKCDIVVEDKQACPRYIGTLIEGICVHPSQEKIRQYVMALGMRPINNIVDITNFCLLETGQPLHAFDYDKLIGGKIIVRRAKKGEKIITLDDIERALDPSILVIADEKRPVAIAGIMGGKATEVTAATKNILLESAYFDQALIRRASRKVGLSSDSSYRFERGVDMQTVETGAGRAIDLILGSAQGNILKRTDVYAAKKKTKATRIRITVETINKRIGSALPATQCKDILKRLDFSVSSGEGGVFNVVPPSFRQDVKAEEDIIEEISRIIGFDRLPLRFPPIKVSTVSSNPKGKARCSARELLLAQGFDEIITYTMIHRDGLRKSKQESREGVAIFNPLTQDQEIMRPSMLPSFLPVLLSNVNRGQKNLRFFEAGKIYTAKGEEDVLGIMIVGTREDDWRIVKKENADYYDLKGVLVQTIKRLGGVKTTVQFKSGSEECFAPGESADVFMDGKAMGSLGKIDQDVLDLWDIKHGNVLFAEVRITELYAQKKPVLKYQPISEFPAVSRDISLAVAKTVTAGDVERVIRKTMEGEKEILLANLKFVEKYEGEKIPKDQRGLIFSLTYQARKARTLRDEEVTGAHEKVCEALVQGLGVVRR